jgi:hypothetical protein
MNNDPYQKYNILTLVDIPAFMCINLAFENNEKDKMNQILYKNKYNQYDCLVKNIVNNNFTNVNKKSIIETISSYISFSPSSHNESSKYQNECNSQKIDFTPITNITDIHEYNQFYVYGLTTLNGLLIIMIIIIIFIISNDIHKHSHMKYNK